MKKNSIRLTQLFLTITILVTATFLFAADNGVTLPGDTINTSVDGVFSYAGIASISATEGAARLTERDGTSGLTAAELKYALLNNKVVLSIRNHDNSGNRFQIANRLASNVAALLDKSDGNLNGYVNLSNAPAALKDVLSVYSNGQYKNGIFANILTRSLTDGDLLVGKQFMSRNTAASRGYDIIEIHQDAAGWKFTKGR